MVTEVKSFRDRAISIFKMKPKDPNDFKDAIKIIFEKFPRIALMIDVTWGSRELHQKLTTLLQVDNVKREGFPPDVCDALMTIQDRHMDEFGFEPFADTFMDSRLPDHW